jgi:hypothetical protein
LNINWSEHLEAGTPIGDEPGDEAETQSLEGRRDRKCQIPEEIRLGLRHIGVYTARNSRHTPTFRQGARKKCDVRCSVPTPERFRGWNVHLVKINVKKILK